MTAGSSYRVAIRWISFRTASGMTTRSSALSQRLFPGRAYIARWQGAERLNTTSTTDGPKSQVGLNTRGGTMPHGIILCDTSAQRIDILHKRVPPAVGLLSQSHLGAPRRPKLSEECLRSDVRLFAPAPKLTSSRAQVCATSLGGVTKQSSHSRYGRRQAAPVF